MTGPFRVNIPLAAIASVITLCMCWELYGAKSAVATGLPQDENQAVIDVTKYTPDMQAAYKLFLVKCSKCHTIARAINTSMPTGYWAYYIGIMLRKPSSNIDAKDAKVLFRSLLHK